MQDALCGMGGLGGNRIKQEERAAGFEVAMESPAVTISLSVECTFVRLNAAGATRTEIDTRTPFARKQVHIERETQTRTMN